MELGFSVGMEAFDELLLLNVPWIQEFSDIPWIQEFSDVFRLWT